MAKGNNSRDKVTREKQIELICRYRAKSFSFREIAELVSCETNVKITHQTVFNDYVEALKEAKKRAEDTAEYSLVSQIEKLDRLEHQYWLAWDKSKGKVSRKKIRKNGRRGDTSVEAEETEQNGDPALEARLNNGELSQEQYDSAVAKLDAELDKKKAEIARKQAIREKLMNVFDIGINTAAAVMKNTAQLGLPLSIPVNIATIALGAVQLATVLATPLPKASRGKLLSGPSHAAGGTIIEAEGGEAIINKRSVSMFAPLLSAINEAGGGVPFVRPLSDGGYSARSSASQGITVEEMKIVMEEAMSKLKIYTTIEDIRRADKNYSTIEGRARY